MFNPFSQPSPRPGRQLFDPNTPRKSAPLARDREDNIVLQPNDQQLYANLLRLKERIQEDGRRDKNGKTKRAPVVCNDEVLRQFATRRPTTADEMSVIPGVSDHFMEQFSSRFLPLIKASTVEAETTDPPTTETQRATLAKLENQLASINRRNRLLYLPKIRPAQVWDLASQEAKGVVFNRKVFFGSSTVQITKTFEDSRAPKRVVREATKYHRETGQETLYIAYPFVSGCLPGDRFDVRAPLAFIPVVAVNKGNGLAVKRDEQRDIVYNSTLLLAHYKTSEEVRSLPDTSLEDIKSDTFFDDLLEFYAAEGLAISAENLWGEDNQLESAGETEELLNVNGSPTDQGAATSIGTPENQEAAISSPSAEDQETTGNPEESSSATEGDTNKEAKSASHDVLDHPLQNFTNYLADEFPKVNEGELYLENVAVLGHFPMFDNAVQSDIAEIASQPNLPVLVSEFLSTLDRTEHQDVATISQRIPVEDSQIYYINPLNSSQEQVVNAMRGRDSLVVQGPPGTGKSQVITSLIADYVAKDRSVLMVSEKRSALDVVYSRLGPLNSHAILLDNLHNKELFYGQINTVLNTTSSGSVTLQDVYKQGQAIDMQVNRLADLANVYEPSELGISIGTLYLACKWLDITSNPLDHERYRVFMAHAASFTNDLHYPELAAAHNVFNDGITFERTASYLQSVNFNPWINEIKGSLTAYETMQMQDEMQGLATLAEDWRKKNVLSRWWNKNNLLKKITGFFEQYFDADPSQKATDFLNRGINQQALAQFGINLDNRALYNSLTHTDLAYLKALVRMMQQLEVSGTQANDITYETALASILFNFEAQHRNVVETCNSFTAITENINALIAKKIKDTIKAINHLLTTDVTNGIPKKEYAEMLRLANNKRRRSTTQFISSFWPELARGIKIWMMTPEVVSEALPLQPNLFDLVVFDEASQMYPEKGIPALYRAKQAVVAGDSQQLRPSAIGKGRISNAYDEYGDDSQDSAAVLEEQSFLDVANYKFVPPVVLNFHYRSRYEELIAFSNYAFYDGTLIVSPNVAPPVQPPIQVIQTPEGLWEDQVNRAEAKRVVELLEEILTNRTDDATLGIITFNAKQRDLIEDLLEDTAQFNPGFYEKLLVEMGRTDNGEDIGLFVKNIENVQGDERDIIIFSTAFAPTPTSTKVANRFGSLSHDGGENRLNVAISRAKQQIYLVTSITPDQLNTDGTTYRGPKLLKSYLSYCYAVSNGDSSLAQTILRGLSNTSAPPVEQPDDDIALHDTLVTKVEMAIQEAGFETARNVGIGGYTIELAIMRDGKYLVGVEFDTEIYSTYKDTRERDLHRLTYLQIRGWLMMRVWAPAWWRDPQGVVAHLVKAAEGQIATQSS